MWLLNSDRTKEQQERGWAEDVARRQSELGFLCVALPAGSSFYEILSQTEIDLLQSSATTTLSELGVLYILGVLCVCLFVFQIACSSSLLVTGSI